jgi:hypothetical protein
MLILGDVTCRSLGGIEGLCHCSPGLVLAPITVCTCCEVMATAEFMMGSRRTCRGLTVRAKREPVPLTLRFVGNNRSFASVQYAKHVIMNLMWIAMLFTRSGKNSNQLGTSIYFHGTAESCSTSSVHHVAERAIKKAGSSGQHPEGMIDMMTVVRDMTRRRSRVRF